MDPTSGSQSGIMQTRDFACNQLVTLSVVGLIPNATIADVMDIRGGNGLLCYEYI
jgi:hypothetical protein